MDENSEYKITSTRKKLVERHHRRKQKVYKDMPGSIKCDRVDEDGKNNPDDDEDDHDIEPITICRDGKCVTAKAVRNK